MRVIQSVGLASLARPRDAEALRRRVEDLRPSATPRWGRMSAPQMVCHVTDALRMAAGEKPVSDASGFFQRTILKWVALYLPLSWPAGIQTRPEIDQQCGGTAPAEFPRDVAQLEALLHRITTEPISWAPHPIFGPMSRRQWLRWAYLHTDHHLRQFGA